ncbi:MAG TPA: ABC transporter permease [Syntrophales bacterium]|nr:ABC transporter permease [Syntrophales bacterium]HOM07496.1 ABC transporter permease [Syntrophales bacterium]HOO00031.1 ABC transporter permease [Syntrophales bacterium]HPC00855.1 ABC transporter permease [Syntrophales bacterium]HPQ07115.1 ABC transporter permease [Syntrophales bacterium]
MNWIRLRELIRKEFLQLFRDRRNRGIIVIAPVVQILVFGYVINFDIETIRVALLDLSQTRESRTVERAFTAGGTFRIERYARDQREVDDLLLRGKVDMAIKIPPDLAVLIHRGETAPIQILVDGTVSNMAAVRVAYTMTVLQQLNRRFMAELYPFRLSYGNIDNRLRTWYNPNLYSRRFFVPGIVAFVVMLISLLFTSMAVIREKERGTMEQLIVTPIKPYELILGKTVPFVIISLIQMSVVLLLAVFWFEVPFAGSRLLFLLGISLFLICSLGIGLFISTISRTQQQAMMTTFFFVQPAFLLSGFVFPIANMPTLVQWLTYLNPFRYILVIIRGIFLKGVGMEVLWPQYLALTVLSTAVFAGAVRRFHKRLD